MTYGIATRSDAESQLAEILLMNSFADVNTAYDAEAILDVCYRESGTFALENVGDDLFWDIVRDNARDEDEIATRECVMRIITERYEETPDMYNMEKLFTNLYKLNAKSWDVSAWDTVTLAMFVLMHRN